MTKPRDAKPVAAKRSRAKAVAKIETVPGRLINKLTVEDGQLTVTGGEDARAAMRKALATSSPDFEALSLTQLTNILKPSGSDDVTVQMNAAIWMMSEIAPQNGLEAMLAQQMIATHHLSMDLARRTIKADGLAQYQAHGNLATKFARTFTAQMEALSKLRRGGEQIVRHIHVGPGAQAVIAETFNAGGSGNG